MKPRLIRYSIIHPELNEEIEIIGHFDPEDDSFEPREALVVKGGRSMNMIRLFEYAGIMEFLTEKTDFRLIYNNQYKYAI